MGKCEEALSSVGETEIRPLNWSEGAGGKMGPGEAHCADEENEALGSPYCACAFVAGTRNHHSSSHSV